MEENAGQESYIEGLIRRYEADDNNDDEEYQEDEEEMDDDDEEEMDDDNQEWEDHDDNNNDDENANNDENDGGGTDTDGYNPNRGFYFNLRSMLTRRGVPINNDHAGPDEEDYDDEEEEEDDDDDEYYGSWQRHAEDELLTDVKHLKPELLSDFDQPYRTVSAEESTMLQSLACAICQDVVDDPVGCGLKAEQGGQTCSGIFCRLCLVKHEQEDCAQRHGQGSNALWSGGRRLCLAKCPTCRRDMMHGVVSNWQCQSQMATEQVICRFHGCNTPLLLHQMKRHETMYCPCVQLACQYAPLGCTWQGPRANYKLHLTQNCGLATNPGLLLFIQKQRKESHSLQQRLRRLEQRQVRDITRMQQELYYIQAETRHNAARNTIAEINSNNPRRQRRAHEVPITNPYSTNLQQPQRWVDRANNLANILEEDSVGGGGVPTDTIPCSPYNPLHVCQFIIITLFMPSHIIQERSGKWARYITIPRDRAIVINAMALLPTLLLGAKLLWKSGVIYGAWYEQVARPFGVCALEQTFPTTTSTPTTLRLLKLQWPDFSTCVNAATTATAKASFPITPTFFLQIGAIFFLFMTMAEGFLRDENSPLCWKKPRLIDGDNDDRRWRDEAEEEEGDEEVGVAEVSASLFCFYSVAISLHQQTLQMKQTNGSSSGSVEEQVPFGFVLASVIAASLFVPAFFTSFTHRTWLNYPTEGSLDNFRTEYVRRTLRRGGNAVEPLLWACVFGPVGMLVTQAATNNNIAASSSVFEVVMDGVLIWKWFGRAFVSSSWWKKYSFWNVHVPGGECHLATLSCLCVARIALIAWQVCQITGHWFGVRLWNSYHRQFQEETSTILQLLWDDEQGGGAAGDGLGSIDDGTCDLDDASAVLLDGYFAFSWKEFCFVYARAMAARLLVSALVIPVTLILLCGVKKAMHLGLQSFEIGYATLHGNQPEDRRRERRWFVGPFLFVFWISLLEYIVLFA